MRGIAGGWAGVGERAFHVGRRVRGGSDSESKIWGLHGPDGERGRKRISA